MRSRSWWRSTLAPCALLPLVVAAAPTPVTSPTLMELKAAYLFQFTQFVDWPPDAFRGPREPFVIGVHAHDALADLLEKVVAGEKAGGRAIEVRRLRGPEDAPGCQLAYLPGEAPWAALRAGAVLTVGETEEFWRGGGVIRFVFLRNRVRLHINLDAAREQGLSLTSKLLRIAERVEGAR